MLLIFYCYLIRKLAGLAKKSNSSKILEIFLMYFINNSYDMKLTGTKLEVYGHLIFWG